MAERHYTLLDALFGELVDNVFIRQLQLRDHHLLRYLATMLAEFAHTDRVYRIRDGNQRSLESVVEMLLESDVLLNAYSFERERAVHKHVGDFTLFVSGLWPEWHERARQRGADSAVDYRATGKRSYYIASTFQHEPYGDEAPVLRRLSEEYEVCQFGLSLVRQEMDRLGARPPGLAA